MTAEDIKDVQQIATEESRSVADVLRLLMRLGLAEYERTGKLI
ncbi:MAG: hypothetical protein ACR2RE_03360 [Geminicoccaceae bacterium]